MNKALKSTGASSVAVFFLLLSIPALGQLATGYSAGTGKNPAFAGARGDGTLGLSYSSLFPGGGYNLSAFNISYDTYIEALHGGIGFSLITDHPGSLLTDIRPDFSFSYHLRASKDLYFFAGMSAGLIYRSFSSSRFIFPDQIDPLYGAVLPGNETILQPSFLFFDMGAGLMVVYKTTAISLDASHLFQPDLSRQGIPGTMLDRQYTIQAFSRFNPGAKELFFIPYVELSVGGGRNRLASGIMADYQRLSSGILYIMDGLGGSMQTTFSLGNGRLRWMYAYRFSTGPSHGGIPFSVMHQLGLQIGLNIVDKRNTIKAIILPHL